MNLNFISLKDAAARVGVPLEFLERAVRDQQLPSVRAGHSRARYVHVEDLARWEATALKRQPMSSPAGPTGRAYTLIDPRDPDGGGPGDYAGRTALPLAKRLALHLKHAAAGRSGEVNDWIRELKQAGVEPVIVDQGEAAPWTPKERAVWTAHCRWHRRLRKGADHLKVAKREGDCPHCDRGE